jgi:hypothetical protein
MLKISDDVGYLAHACDMELCVPFSTMGFVVDYTRSIFGGFRVWCGCHIAETGTDERQFLCFSNGCGDRPRSSNHTDVFSKYDFKAVVV